MSSGPAPNTNVPPVPPPLADMMALTAVVMALKQGMDSLSGRAGAPMNRAVTFNDLVNLQLTTSLQAAGSLAPGTTFNSSGAAVSGTASTITPYVVSGFSGPSPFGASQVILGHRFPVKVSFKKNFAPIALSMESVVGSYVNATGAPVLNVQKCVAANDPTVGGNWSTVGSITFASGGHAATLASSAAVVFDEGDFLRIVAPASPDATLAQVFLSLTGQR